jgi:hypothetical protein
VRKSRRDLLSAESQHDRAGVQFSREKLLLRSRIVENPNTSELMLLLEVTRIEDLAAKSSGRVDQTSREKLDRVAKGFRNLAAHPKRYEVKNEDLRRWATKLGTELDRTLEIELDDHTEVELDGRTKEPNLGPDLVIEQLPAAFDYNHLRSTFGLKDTHWRAFQDAREERQWLSR